MTPITDDVSKLSSLVRPLAFFVFFKSYLLNVGRKSAQTVLQKQNIPSDYEIPVSSISKDLVRKSTVMFGPARVHEFEDAGLLFAGRQVLGGLKHIPFGAESSEAGRRVRRRLLQQGTHRCLRIDAEEPPLHL